MPKIRLLVAGTIATAIWVAGCGQTAATSGPREGLNAGARTAERTAQDDASLRIEEFIQRKVPGLVIYRSGSNLTVQIRGQGTLGGSNNTNALVVIDGVPQESPNALLGLQ